MKNTFILAFILSSSLCFSQFLGVKTIDHDTCVDKKFSIVFYIILDSNYTVGTTTPLTLSNVIDTLNSTFKPICVSFENCSTVLIPQYPFRKWRKAITDPVVTSNWYTHNTINIYIVDTIKDLISIPEFGGGYTYPPPAMPGDSTKDVLVFEDAILPNTESGIFHQFGHFFGLNHTHDEVGTGPAAVPGPLAGAVSQEFADGSNCNEHGDCLCDTEADGGPNSTGTDGKGVRYLQPVDNFMAPYPTGCRYTQQQYNKMARCIATRRLYLH